MIFRTIVCLFMVVGLACSVGCKSEKDVAPVIQETPPADAPQRTGAGPVERTRGGGTGRGEGAPRK